MYKIYRKWKRRRHVLYLFALAVIVVFIVLQFLGKHRSVIYDQTDYYSLSENSAKHLLLAAEKENLKRKENIERVCKRYNLGIYKNHNLSQIPIFKQPPAPQYEVFYYDRVHKLSWCPIYKAASSTWLYNFALLGGYTEQEIQQSKIQLSSLVRKRFAQLEYSQAEAAFQDSFKFLIVRHPFERILSAYRDKFENMRVRGYDGTYYFYKSYGSKIVSKYRTAGNDTDLRSLLKPGQYYWSPNEQPPIGIEPTFLEFVRYLIDTDLEVRADDHWIPYYLFCTPCLLSYDAIGKVETMLRDQLYIINQTGLGKQISPKWQHKTNPVAVERSSENQTAGLSEIAKIYFSQLSVDDARLLYEKYKLDFDLFGYDPAEYYKYINN